MEWASIEALSFSVIPETQFEGKGGTIVMYLHI